MHKIAFYLCILAQPAIADSVITTRPIAPNTAVTAQDVTLVAMTIPGALDTLALAIGQEVRVAIPAGRAIKSTDIGALHQINRNARVTLAFSLGGLEIITEGRALSQGGVGDVIDVMNLSSRMRVMGRIGPDGTVHVETGQ